MKVPEKAPLYCPDQVPASKLRFGFDCFQETCFGERDFEEPVTAAIEVLLQQIASMAATDTTGITREILC